ncbi:uncharacterized protein LOC115699705 [Cannabis sativa]|uniref:uncharacterized protein LOC115699705 n=1 Tax=Cannabis sativa TaxID=3483 RepID=UPI0029CAA157|nr:uncharacterized protein LOC115699705 [Cannabis sativa]
MEAQAVARRRISTIASHFPLDDHSLSPTHVLPMNCSSTLNSVIRRYDNKMYFARQGSAYLPNFMRQASNDDVIEETANPNTTTSLNSATRRFDSRLFFARQGSAYQANFMRQGSNDEVLPPPQSDTCPKSSDVRTEGLYYVSPERPSFSRPSFPKQPAEQYHDDPPKFATQSEILSHQREQHSSCSNVMEWSPRMDVAESGQNFVITVEIPGVRVKDIRVEVDDNKLSVAGKRSTQHWQMSGCSNDSTASAYLRREIVEGPYEVVWPLPANVNKDSVSAEFLDGFLRVIIPKL